MSRVLLMIKELRSIQKNSAIARMTLLLAITAAFSGVIFLTDYSKDVNKGLADNLIRLHVIANSDTEEDQKLKRDVRDAIINYMKVELKDSKDLEQTRYIINRNINSIEKIAQNEIAKQGKNYSVKTTMGSYPFPTKAYGDINLPAGYYQALRVVIGQGEGANWWCVLFPPLCFVDATHGTVPDSVKQNLRNTLTEEEYNLIASSADEEDIPIKLKFKVVEFFQNSRIRFSGLVSRIFN